MTQSATKEIYPDIKKDLSRSLSIQACKLMIELAKIDEIPVQDLEEIRKHIPKILESIVESCCRDEYSTDTSMILLVYLNAQFCRKQGLENSVISVLSDYKMCQISESIVFTYNRCITLLLTVVDDYDIELQRHLSSFINQLLLDETTNDYFYTNDASVILDISLRQLTRVQDEDLSLEYIAQIPLVLKVMVIILGLTTKRLTAPLKIVTPIKQKQF